MIHLLFIYFFKHSACTPCNASSPCKQLSLSAGIKWKVHVIDLYLFHVVTTGTVVVKHLCMKLIKGACSIKWVVSLLQKDPIILCCQKKEIIQMQFKSCEVWALKTYMHSLTAQTEYLLTHKQTALGQKNNAVSF